MDTGRICTCPLHQESVTTLTELCRINYPGTRHTYFSQRHVYTRQDLVRCGKGIVYGLRKMEESVNSPSGSRFRLEETESCSVQRCTEETTRHRHPEDAHILEVGKTFTQAWRFTCSSPNSLSLNMDTDYDIMILPNSR